MKGEWVRSLFHHFHQVSDQTEKTFYRYFKTFFCLFHFQKVSTSGVEMSQAFRTKLKPFPEVKKWIRSKTYQRQKKK